MENYCIVLYFLPVLNPKRYDGARVLEASGRPLQVEDGEARKGNGGVGSGRRVFQLDSKIIPKG